MDKQTPTQSPKDEMARLQTSENLGAIKSKSNKRDGSLSDNIQIASKIMDKHKIIKKFREYHSGDFYSYSAICSCKKQLNSWTPKRTDELIQTHLSKEKNNE